MTAAPSFQAGTIVDGRYRIERILGQGAMGVVLAATHVTLGHRVALKVMRDQAAAGSEHQARFLREARIVAMLKTQHAGAVRHMGFLDTGEPYMELDLYEGEDLSAYLRARGPLPVEEAVTYVLQACEAVAEAHAIGVVHRDLKPANLFLTKAAGQPCVKVLDFGVSKLRGDDSRLTQTGVGLGSPLYMSPELMQAAKDADGRSDIWALGTIIYELLTQSTPFTADTIASLMIHVMLHDPTPITAFRRDLPPGLVSAIMRCLAKDPAQRWQSVATFAAQIAPYAPARMQHYVERVAAAQGEAAAARTAAHPSASRGPLAAVGVAIIGGVLVVGMLVLGRRTTSAPAPNAVSTAEQPESPSASAPLVSPVPALELRPIPPAASGSSAVPAPSAAAAATSKPVVTVAPHRPVPPGAQAGDLYDRGTKK